MSAIGQQLNGEISAILAMAGRSLVRISHTHYGSGAGTVIHPDGLILTNAHVVRYGQPTVILPDERQLPAKILAYDAQLDLAALAVEGHNLPPLELGDSKKLQPGELVFALGHPWGVNGAVSAGSVICVGRSPELPTTNEFIQSDLQLRPGHSGGPMVDMQGRLVGINTLITGPEVGLAIPVHVIKEFLQHALAA